MGYFSEMALNKQEELGLPAEQVSAGNAFEDEETFDELPVPSASHSAASPTVETPSSPAFDADDGAEELAEMNGDDASEAADTDGEVPVKSRRHPPRPMQPPMRTRKNAVPSMRRLKPSVKQNGKPGRLKRKRPSRSSWSVWPR